MPLLRYPMAALGALLLFANALPAAPQPEREWHLADGTTQKWCLFAAYNTTAYFETDGYKVTALPIAALTPEDAAEVVRYSREQDAAALAHTIPEGSMLKHLHNETYKMVAGRLRRPDWTGVPEPEFYAIYYSAGWCPPCHRYTPLLVNAYNGHKKLGETEFEVVFISRDRGAGAMRAYMREFKMPWPVVTGSYGESAEWCRYEGDGIPCLVIVDRDGRLLVNTYENGEYQGPESAWSKLVVLLDSVHRREKGGHTVQNPFINNDRLNEAIAQREQALSAKGASGDAPPGVVLMDLRAAPDLVKEDAPETTIIVEVQIDPHGDVTQLEVMDPAWKPIEERLRTCSLLWKMIPAFEAGKPISSRVRIPLKVKIPQPAAA